MLKGGDVYLRLVAVVADVVWWLRGCFELAVSDNEERQSTNGVEDI